MSDEKQRPPVRRVERPKRQAPEAWFEGEVQMEPVHDGSTLPVRQGRVHFHDGARTRWHLHQGDQVLYFVSGQGMVEERGGVLLECEVGDIVHVDGGIVHRHGARPCTALVDTIWEGDATFPG